MYDGMGWDGIKAGMGGKKKQKTIQKQKRGTEEPAIFLPLNFVL